jgi:hypothetical protein
MLYKQVAALAALILVLASAIVGCGRSNAGTSTDALTRAPSTGPVVNSEFAEEAETRETFIKQADAICAKTDETQTKGIEAHAPKNAKTLSDAEKERLLQKFALPPIRQEAKELAALSAPEGEAAAFQSFVEAIERAVGKAEADPHSVLIGSGPFAPVEDMGGKFGFTVCNTPA